MAVSRPTRRRTKDDAPYTEGMTVYEVTAFAGGLISDHPTWRIYEHHHTWMATNSLFVEREGKHVRLGAIETYYAERRSAVAYILAEIRAFQAVLEAEAAGWRAQLKAKSSKMASGR